MVKSQICLLFTGIVFLDNQLFLQTNFDFFYLQILLPLAFFVNRDFKPGLIFFTTAIQKAYIL
jgi:hypothetical protein